LRGAEIEICQEASCMKRKSKMKSQKEEGDNSCDHVIIQKLTKNNIRNKRNKKLLLEQEAQIFRRCRRG
jgi:hypothetical protein